jgi:transposase
MPITDLQRRTLERWLRAQRTPQQVALRTRIILMAADGVANNRIAGELGVSRSTVIFWRSRFAAGGPGALSETAPGRGRKPSVGAEQIKAIVDATLQTRPPGATQWSCRTMARAQGVSPATVQRIWDAHGLAPHRVRTFKLSRDPRFTEKLTDVVGLYLNPPDKAIVLCVDEKSQIQALDRTQPSLPLKRGRAGTLTHDLLEGTVIGECHARHRHQEFLAFLRRLDRTYPPDLELHLIVDNYGTHTHAEVAKWLAAPARARFHLHFTPTGSSWLNLVERWFRELTTRRLRRGVFRSVPDLVATIYAYIALNNADPKPFVWTASVEAILAKVGRCRAILETAH